MKKTNLLIVDDELSVLNSLKFILRPNFEITVAQSGQSALKLIEGGYKVELVLSDEKMPDIPGHQFLKRIYEMYPESIRMIITGYSDQDSLVRAVNQGHIHAYLTKPWNNNELKITMAQAQREFMLRSENYKLEKAVEQTAAELQKSKANLKETQTKLVAQERLISLGMLLSGVVQEIKNPLNFVNNFSAECQELVEILGNVLSNSSSRNGETKEINKTFSLLKQSLEMIHQHGERADHIVQHMQSYARQSNGTLQSTNIQAIVQEYLIMAYHKLRADNADFTIKMETEYDFSLSPCMAVPEDLGRVFLNLFNNAFYALQQKQATHSPDFTPTLLVKVEGEEHQIIIRIRDNGVGISKNKINDIFKPFYTSKPAGAGAGLGLSLSYEIIVHEHEGGIDVQSEEGQFTEVTVFLPKN